MEDWHCLKESVGDVGLNWVGPEVAFVAVEQRKQQAERNVD